MKHQILISFKINATYSNVPIQFNEEFSPWFEWLVSELSSYKKIHFVFCIIKSARYNLIKIVYQIVGNKAKGQISKRVLQENIAGQIFRKTNYFLSLIRTRTCALLLTKLCIINNSHRQRLPTVTRFC